MGLNGLETQKIAVFAWLLAYNNLIFTLSRDGCGEIESNPHISSL